jgi:hypothetical protein
MNETKSIIENQISYLASSIELFQKKVKHFEVVYGLSTELALDVARKNITLTDALSAQKILSPPAKEE